MLSLTHQCHSVINQCHPYISLFKAASLIAIKELPKYKAFSLIVWAQPLHGTFLFDPGISIDKYTVKSCVILIIWLRQKGIKGNAFYMNIFKHINDKLGTNLNYGLKYH